MQKFSDGELADIQQKLDAERAKVQERIAELSAQDPFADPDRLNDNAALDMEATEESDHDRVVAIIEELKLREKEIEAALERITQGTYGVCSNCGQPIETQRLNVIPTATLCLACEQKKQAGRGE